MTLGGHNSAHNNKKQRKIRPSQHKDGGKAGTVQGEPLQLSECVGPPPRTFIKTKDDNSLG